MVQGLCRAGPAGCRCEAPWLGEERPSRVPVGGLVSSRARRPAAVRFRGWGEAQQRSSGARACLPSGPRQACSCEAPWLGRRPQQRVPVVRGLSRAGPVGPAAVRLRGWGGEAQQRVPVVHLSPSGPRSACSCEAP